MPPSKPPGSERARPGVMLGCDGSVDIHREHGWSNQPVTTVVRFLLVHQFHGYFIKYSIINQLIMNIDMSQCHNCILCVTAFAKSFEFRINNLGRFAFVLNDPFRRIASDTKGKTQLWAKSYFVQPSTDCLVKGSPGEMTL